MLGVFGCLLRKVWLVGLLDRGFCAVAIIEASNGEVAKVEADYDEKLSALNQDYTKKTNDMMREESANARKEFESFDATQVAADMKALDTEIATSPSFASTTAQKPLSNKPTSHTFRNFILVLFVLAALAGAVLYALSVL